MPAAAEGGGVLVVSSWRPRPGYTLLEAAEIDKRLWSGAAAAGWKVTYKQSGRKSEPNASRRRPALALTAAASADAAASSAASSPVPDAAPAAADGDDAAPAPIRHDYRYYKPDGKQVMNRAKALAEAPEGALPDAEVTALAVRGHRPVDEAAAAAGAPLLPEAGGAIVPAGGAIVPAKKKRGKMSAYDGVKGPTTAYLYYQNEVREAVADEHPEMSTHQLMQEIGRRWRALSDEEKAPYKKKNEDDIARYHRDKRAHAETAAAAAAEVLEGPSGSAAAAQELITDAAEWASAAAAAPRVLGAIARGEHLTGSAAPDADADDDVAAVEWGEEDAWEPPLAPGERTKYRGFPHLSAADNSTRSLCWKGGPLNHQPPKRNHAPPVQHFWAEARRPAASSSAAPQIQGFDPDVKTSFWSAVPSGVHGRMIDRFRGFRAESTPPLPNTPPPRRPTKPPRTR